MATKIVGFILGFKELQFLYDNNIFRNIGIFWLDELSQISPIFSHISPIFSHILEFLVEIWQQKK